MKYSFFLCLRCFLRYLSIAYFTKQRRKNKNKNKTVREYIHLKVKVQSDNIFCTKTFFQKHLILNQPLRSFTPTVDKELFPNPELRYLMTVNPPPSVTARIRTASMTSQQFYRLSFVETLAGLTRN